MRAYDVVARLCPKGRPEYLAAFRDGDALLGKYGITTPLRLAHFLAQVCHETGALTIGRESGAYTARRILQVFGVGKHSAGVTQAEAAKLANNGPALFERVYGLGNPRKAKDLGNTSPGDGWKYRGNGLMQTTGRGAHRRLGQSVGVGTLFERDPDLLMGAEHALYPALAEWQEINGNGFADKNDIGSITKRINGGYNGFEDRKKWFGKIYPLLSAGVSWQEARPDEDMREVQQQLVDLGYDVVVDGRKGPATEKAIKDFQRANGLKVDGIAGPMVRERMKGNLAALKSNTDTAEKPLPESGALASTNVQAGLGLVGAGGVTAGAVADGAGKAAALADVAQKASDTAGDVQAHLSAGTYVGLAVAAVLGLVGLYFIWRRLKDADALPRWLGGTA